MKTAGMIGGIGPESTAIYYRRIVAEYRQAKPDGSYPCLIINSIDMQKMRDMVIAREMENLTEYLLHEIGRLATAGASFGFLASNTPHLVFDELQKRSPIPLLSIVKTACAAAKKQGFKRLGLIGARFTMEATFYQEEFSQEGIAVVAPGRVEQDYIHAKYMDELVNGLVVPATRVQFVKIMQQMQEQQGIEGVILGGTELPLLFQEDTAAGIPLLDTTQMHVRAIVEQMLK